ncbi:MAG TPA: hypothetical protein PKE12_15185 [Kiritimatiellia bacterium]|nr:hypothetical protein [Kiritimatiellia bacterium]
MPQGFFEGFANRLKISLLRREIFNVCKSYPQAFSTSVTPKFPSFQHVAPIMKIFVSRAIFAWQKTFTDPASVRHNRGHEIMA